MRTFNTGQLTFEYPDSWEAEKADILSNPDCVATLSKGEENLINAVMFPTATDLDGYKIFMEDAISDDGGVILASDFVQIANLNAIKLHANMDTPEINFDIHTYVFIEQKRRLRIRVKLPDSKLGVIIDAWWGSYKQRLPEQIEDLKQLIEVHKTTRLKDFFVSHR
jgi:hypothetical protein